MNRRHLLSCAFIVMGVYCLVTTMSSLMLYLVLLIQQTAIEGSGWAFHEDRRPFLLMVLTSVAARLMAGGMLICLSSALARRMTPESASSPNHRAPEWADAALHVGLTVVGFILLLGALNQFSQSIMISAYPAFRARWVDLCLQAVLRTGCGVYLFLGAPGLRYRFLKRLTKRCSPRNGSIGGTDT